MASTHNSPAMSNLDNHHINSMSNTQTSTGLRTSSSRKGTFETKITSHHGHSNHSGSRRSSQSRSISSSSHPSSKRSHHSRPTTYHRARTSPLTPKPKLDEAQALALHQRSCAIFQTVSGPYPVRSGASSIKSFPTTTVTTSPITQISPTSSPFRENGTAFYFRNQPSFCREADEEPDVDPCAHFPPTAKYYTLPETRHREYAHIEKWSKGWRAVWRKIAPKCVAGGDRIGFYHGKGGDGSSVRRYRVDVPDDDEAEESSMEEDEKRGLTKMEKQDKKKVWGCF
ncbi:hypothetical protein M501DRAFT_1020236 [Patellaria atrata CBS 101060]|uniref:Uncharacterized protein n=1 Tax=Patellaria atrata CBS 101060 TaxID=1346257 RepID=A0A9P4S3W8_9PEZI|nr:hypothetical protein M501DRAFT_1020236 [Patellaria atrata CBS 101060]